VFLLNAQDLLGRPDARVEDYVGDGRKVFSILVEGGEEPIFFVLVELVQPALTLLLGGREG
jgi:hypothetical protein